MPSDKEPTTAPLTLLVEELCPGQVIMYNDRPKQVRGINVHASRTLEPDMRTLTAHSATYTVVLCDENGEITTVDLPYNLKVTVVFFEVFEPGIPAGYVSRKNFKKCYEDSLASVDGVGVARRIVNNGSKWRAKKDIRYMFRRFPEGTVCTVYALGTDQTSCRLMLPGGGDLGNIGVTTLQHDFYYVGETAPEASASEDTSAAGTDIVVKLTYFKPSGKYYSEGEYVTKETSFWLIEHEVCNKLLSGDNPGLMDMAVLRNDFTTSISIQREELSVPHVITVHALCAEMTRRSQNDVRGYAKSVPKEALDMYERHRRDLSYILPDHLQDPAELIEEVDA
jgi:hypothetical protein